MFSFSPFFGGEVRHCLLLLCWKSPLQQVDSQNTQGGAFVPLSRPRLWFLPGLLFSVYVVNQLAWSLLCPPLVQGAPVSCRVQVALGPDFKSGRTSTDRGRTNWNRWEVSFDLGWGIGVHLLRPSLDCSCKMLMAPRLNLLPLLLFSTAPTCEAQVAANIDIICQQIKLTNTTAVRSHCQPSTTSIFNYPPH